MCQSQVENLFEQTNFIFVENIIFICYSCIGAWNMLDPTLHSWWLVTSEGLLARKFEICELFFNWRKEWRPGMTGLISSSSAKMFRVKSKVMTCSVLKLVLTTDLPNKESNRNIHTQKQHNIVHNLFSKTGKEATIVRFKI